MKLSFRIKPFVGAHKTGAVMGSLFCAASASVASMSNVNQRPLILKAFQVLCGVLKAFKSSGILSRVDLT